MCASLARLRPWRATRRAGAGLWGWARARELRVRVDYENPMDLSMEATGSRGCSKRTSPRRLHRHISTYTCAIGMATFWSPPTRGRTDLFVRPVQRKGRSEANEYERH